MVSPAELGIPDRVGVPRFPGHEPREALSPSLNQVKPSVLTKRGVGVRLSRRIEQLRERNEIVVVDMAL